LFRGILGRGEKKKKKEETLNPGPLGEGQQYYSAKEEKQVRLRGEIAVSSRSKHKQWPPKVGGGGEQTSVAQVKEVVRGGGTRKVQSGSGLHQGKNFPEEKGVH